MKKTIVSSALLTVLCLTAGAQTSEPKFIRTATTPAFETDFTNAAEKTVNAVVCIKSFATRAQQGYGQGGYDPFGMFDFFFGNPSNLGLNPLFVQANFIHVFRSYNTTADICQSPSFVGLETRIKII